MCVVQETPLTLTLFDVLATFAAILAVAFIEHLYARNRPRL